MTKAERVAEALIANGITPEPQYGYGIHSWRCEHGPVEPEQPTTCDCFAALVADILKTLNQKETP